MKKFSSIILAILTLSTFIYYLLRHSCAGFSGKISIENSIKKCIMHYGYVNLENVTILENTFVSGKLVASNASLNDIKINGELFLYQSSIINGKVNIDGLLVSSSTKFEKPIFITSSKIELNDGTVTKDIYIMKHRIDSKEEFLYIDNSTVDGDIIFESNLGKVILINGSKILGNVYGGKILTN